MNNTLCLDSILALYLKYQVFKFFKLRSSFPRFSLVTNELRAGKNMQVKKSELNSIYRELDLIEETLNNAPQQFDDFEQEIALDELEKIITKLEAEYKSRTSEKVIQLF